MATNPDILSGNLLEKTGLLNVFFESDVMGMALYSPGNGWLEFNDTFCNLLGHSREELFQLSLTEIIPLDDFEIFNAEQSLLLEGEIDKYSLGLRYIRKNGENVYVGLSVNCVRYETGKVQYITVFINDITQSKQRQEEEFHYQFLVDKYKDVVVHIDRNYTYKAVNQNFLELMQKENEQVVGCTISEIMGEKHFETREKKHVDKCLQGESVSVCEWVTIGNCQNRFLNFLYTPSCLREGKPIGVVNIIRDITDHKRLEDALHEREARLRVAERVAKLGFWEVDTEGVIYFSDECYSVFGIKPGEISLTNDCLLDLIHPDDRERIKAEWGRIFENRSRFDAQYRVFHPDGQLHYLHSQGEYVVDSERGTGRFIGTVMDVTVSKEQERMITQSRERLRNLAERLHAVREEEREMISRELHDGLAQILTGLKLELSSIGKQLPRNWKNLPNQINAMASLVDSTLEMSRDLAFRLRPAMLDDLGIEAAIELEVEEMAKRTECTYVINLRGGKGNKQPNHDITLFRVLQEALVNIARHAKATEIQVNLYDTDTHQILEIEDDGVGISEDVLQSTRSLGLIGMRERTGALGGRISFMKGKERGTKVVLKLPLEVGNYD